jgi:septal ring factor EnvC (AmiA/AmiB activator)
MIRGDRLKLRFGALVLVAALAAPAALLAQSEPSGEAAAAGEPVAPEVPSSEAPAAESPTDAPIDPALAIDAAQQALDAAAMAAAAAEGPAVEGPVDAASALSEIEASISLSAERAAELKREIEDLQGDRARQSAALIAAAQRVKLAEVEIAAMEERLGDLIVAELEVRGRLEGAGDTISGVLAALERISRNPPPALIVDPSDALGSARGAILIAAIVPQLQARADQLMADLGRLDDIKAAALEEEALLKANFEILEEEQLRIAVLIAARKANEDRATAELEAEEAEAQALADRATSLKQLIDELTRQVQAVAVAAEATATANAGGTAPLLDPETIRLALANTERAEPAVPFAQARGYLTVPSSGVNVIEYGASDGFGGISQGLSIVTRAEAQVVSPADGWVLYKGDYLNYGQIVIINAGQDYTILLAGLASVSVDIGQFVLMGEPVGTMGSRTIGQTVTTSAGVARPTLYIEMRKNNEPVDPTEWWAPPQTPTQSG